MRFRGAWLLAAALCGCGRLARAPGWWNALEAAERSPLRAEEALRVTSVSETPERTVNVVQVRGAVKAHRHLRSDETLTLVRGAGLFTLGAEKRRARPGDVIFIPRGTPHAYLHEGEGETVAVSVFTPAFKPGDRVFEP